MTFLKYAIDIAAQLGLFVVYIYAIVFAGYPMFIGIWPAFIVFCALYWIVFSSIGSTLNTKRQIYLITITAIVLLGLTYLGQSNANTLREQLIVDGVPTLFGLTSIVGHSCLTIFGAMGFGAFGKQIHSFLAQY